MTAWTKAGVIAGIVAALAASAVFVLPTPLFGNDNSGGRASSAGSASGVSPVPTATDGARTASVASTTSTASGGRRLVDMRVSAGQGFVMDAGAGNLRMPCGTNQSDDTYRQIEYDLPAPYSSFSTAVAPFGKADPEAFVGVQVYVRTRYDRSNRITLAKTVTAQVGQTVALSADLTRARSFLVRLRCSTSSLAITLQDPRIIH